MSRGKQKDRKETKSSTNEEREGISNLMGGS
jgi:hypothetical protein